MIDLEDEVAVRAGDPGGMLATIAALPGHCREGYRLGREVAPAPSAQGVTAVAVCGMGGSAVAGDVIRALYAHRLAVPEVIRENGGTPVRTRVGHSFIKQVMAESGAVFGGEHSGHYYFRDNYRADSGLIAAVVVLEQLSLAGVPLSKLLEPFRRYRASGEINSRVEDKQEAIEKIAAAFPDGRQDRTDGLTVEFDRDWWFNVRPSNTESLLRLNVEARTEELLKEKTRAVLDLIQREGGYS